MIKSSRKNRELKNRKREKVKQRTEIIQNYSSSKQDTVMVFAFPYSVSKSVRTYTARG